MSRWRAFPENSWSEIGPVLSGFGPGEGAYGLSYALEVSRPSILNGRVSATIILADSNRAKSVGLVARGDESRSFICFYIVKSDLSRREYSVRLAAFKLGKLVALAGLKKIVRIPGEKFQMSLQFFSGEVVGQMDINGENVTLKYLLPSLPFSGACGIIRFYDTSALIKNIHIEEIKMKPILSHEANLLNIDYKFRVFLSYASLDKADVLKVAAQLKAAGITYWIDSEQITFGDGIVTKIEDGLENSKYVVACLSQNLKKSGWCRAEYGPILYREFSGDSSKKVIPLLLDDSPTSGIPLLLSDKMRADFRDSKNFSEFIEFLQEGKSLV